MQVCTVKKMMKELLLLGLLEKLKEEETVVMEMKEFLLKVEGKVCKVIVDGGSCHNLASKEMCDKLGLKLS
ncbi:hypothetical protein E2562_012014 [Oryza meyeriana var. granulata]|uniref:Aspartic peptidase DDI1-type domain-containing protein n=1 Tax=Oryza meyeriana var. granulata TaxID=110450 RepID=A0A6G1F754_9ORYZ|nr:hypothetical protein E2562_012014 [Oryza meyeriana var. granulata]